MNTVIIIITIPIITVILLLLLMVFLISLNSFYRSQNVQFEEVYFLGSELTPLFFLQILFLRILEKYRHTQCVFFNMSLPKTLGITVNREKI